MKSIIQDKKECYLCRAFYGLETVRDLEEHHIIHGTANRSKSEEHGLKVWLCAAHHRNAKYSVHKCSENDVYLKCAAQQKWEQSRSREQFIEEFGKSYL